MSINFTIFLLFFVNSDHRTVILKRQTIQNLNSPYNSPQTAQNKPQTCLRQSVEKPEIKRGAIAPQKRFGKGFGDEVPEK